MSNNVEFSIRGIDDFSAVFDKLNSSLEILKLGFEAVVAAYPIEKLKELAAASLDNAEAMYFAAQRAEVSIDTFSSMAAAMSMAGVSTDSLQAAYKFLGKSLADNSVTPASKELEALGIATKDPQEAMLKLADVFANTADDANKTAVAVMILGRGGISMVPGLNEGSEGMKRMQQAAIDLGQQIGPDFGASSRQINDNLTQLSWTITGSVNKAMAELSPTIEHLTSSAVAWIKESGTMDVLAGVLYASFKALVVVTILVVDTIAILAVAIKNVAMILYDFEEGMGGIFDAVVTSLGTIGAALIEVAQGHFTNAKQIMMDGADQTDKAWKTAGDHFNAAAVGISTTFSDASKQIADDAVQMGEILDGTMESIAAEEAKAAKAKRDAANSIAMANADLTKSYDELLKKVTEAATSAQGQVMAFGMSADQVKQYDLSMQLATLTAKGLDEEQQAAIKTQLTTLKQYADLHDAQEQNKKDMAEEAHLVKETETPYEKFSRTMQELIDLGDRFPDSAQAVSKAMQNEADKFLLAQTRMQEYKDHATSVTSTLDRLYANQQKTLGSVAFQVADGLLHTFNTLSKGVGDAVASALVDGASFMTLMDAVLKTAVKNIISSLVELGIQQAVYAALGMTLENTAATGKISDEAGVVYTAAFADSAMMGPAGLIAAPAVAMAAAATAEAVGLSFMATGIAHGGMDFIPAESTYLLQKGERVLSPNQNSDLTSALQKGGQGGGGAVTIGAVHIHIMEKATNTGAFATMNKIDLRNKLGQPVIDALNEMYKMGRRPNFAMQKK